MNDDFEMSDEDRMDVYYSCDDPAFAKLAFDKLYRHYFPRLVAYFRCRGVPREDAEDLAEETFLRVVRTKKTGVGRFDRTRSSFRTWLFTIARHYLCDYWRKRGRRVEAGAEPGEGVPAAEDIPAEEPTPEEQAAAAELSKPVRDCLARLPEREREVLLHSIEGFTLAEIAQILEVRYGTAGRLLHYARKQMRRCLESKGYRQVPRGSALPPGTTIIMTFPDELWIHLDQALLEREGYRFVPAGGALPPGARVVLAFPVEVLVKMSDAHQE